MSALAADGRMLGGGGVALTPEQAAAVARRDGPLLLSANAGSGKTTVLAERFVRSVVEDDVAPTAILAITFTDRAAGGLRSRIRERFAELGRRDAVRALESAWISTFHGLCARVLRANAVRAGLDPQFRVLDEAEARAVRGDAFERALAAFLDDGRPAALDLVAAYGVDRLTELITARHDELRSRGLTRPRLPAVPGVGGAGGSDFAARARLDAALAAALAEVAADDERASVQRARTALERCGALLAGGDVRVADLDAAGFRPGNTAALKGPGCTEYLAAHEAYGAALRDAEAVAAVALLDELLGRHADAYAEAKRARAAVDFDDLELLCRDLLRDAPAVRDGLRARFARVMVDEFQDTNAVQLELLDLLGGDRFVVGDELQSIYAFRHADVEIFRAERERLRAAGATAELATNFRSRPAILGVVDDAFGAGHGPAHVPFVAGRDEAGRAPGPIVELLLTDAEAAAGFPPATFATLPTAPAWRQAEARLVAQRIADLVEREGVPASDVVVLLRSVADVAVFERAIEEQGLATLASGGRGYWGRQQVLDLCAYLGALANPRDEGALFGLLASPLAGLTSDGLALVAMAAKPGARWEALARAFCASEPAAFADDLGEADRDLLATFCPWFAGERARAPRLGLDELLERVVDRTGYDLHVLNLPAGRRRWANVLKLQRLAAGFEARRGRDVRGLIDLATAELDAEAREADAPVELGDASAVRLMTIHAAKGLEFPVVVIADLGRQGPRDAADLLVRGDRVGLRLRTVDGGRAEALGWRALRDAALQADAEEERRILHVAMTRAEERLILSGAIALDADAYGRAPKPGDAPIAWLAPALAPDLFARLEHDGPVFDTDPSGAGRVRVTVSGPESGALRAESLAPALVATVAAEAPGRGVPAPVAMPSGQLALDLGGAPPAKVEVWGAGLAPPPAPLAEPPRPLPAALSYSSLSAYARCSYRWYLERVLRLPREDPRPALAALAAADPDAPELAEPGLDPLVRGSLAHELLEELDFARPAPPTAEAVRDLADRREVELTGDDVADLQGLVAAFADSPLAARLAAAPDVRREHGFVVAGGDGPLLNGIVDVLAFEPSGDALIVDYKTDVVGPDADLEAYVEADYGAQRRIYALAALGAGAPAVEVAHLFLARPGEPAVARYVAADAPRLRAELEPLAEGIAAGRFVPSTRPHRALCLTCPGRRGLCHHPEELTLREDPAPGAPAPR